MHPAALWPIPGSEQNLAHRLQSLGGHAFTVGWAGGLWEGETPAQLSKLAISVAISWLVGGKPAESGSFVCTLSHWVGPCAVRVCAHLALLGLHH